MFVCVYICVIQGALYAKYKPEKLLEHLKLFSTRINIPRLIRCVKNIHTVDA